MSQRGELLTNHVQSSKQQNPERTKSRKTKFRMDKIPNWTKSRMDKILNWTKSRMGKFPDKILNGQNPELDKILYEQKPELDKIQNPTNFKNRAS